MYSLQIYVPQIKINPFSLTTTYRTPAMLSPCVFLQLILHEYSAKYMFFWLNGGVSQRDGLLHSIWNMGVYQVKTVSRVI